MPLLWAHAEYIKLLRSAPTAKFMTIPEVNQRYVTNRVKREPMEVWKLDRRLRFMPKGSILRIHGNERFRLRWSNDNWHSQHDIESTANALQIDFVDLPANFRHNCKRQSVLQLSDVKHVHVNPNINLLNRVRRSSERYLAPGPDLLLARS
jgi:hypothetical protein